MQQTPRLTQDAGRPNDLDHVIGPDQTNNQPQNDLPPSPDLSPVKELEHPAIISKTFQPNSRQDGALQNQDYQGFDVTKCDTIPQPD